MISYLVDLKALEALPLIEQVFASGNVDLFVCGDFEDVQIELGLLEERLTPPPDFRPFKNWPDLPTAPDESKPDPSQTTQESEGTPSKKPK